MSVGLPGLLVTASDDLVVRVYDVISAKRVRQFDGPKDRITDICFSADGKWILLSSMDGTIRIWDVIASKQLDAMLMDDPVTRVSLSPNMDMLATTHVAHNGIYLWYAA
jgi:U3 small nucleolar RNA-associated protein 21